MDYIKTINELIESGTELLATQFTKNSFFAEMNGISSPTDYVDSTTFLAWKTRIETFFGTHFDSRITEKYTETFQSHWDGANKPYVVKNALALLETAKRQIENKEIIVKNHNSNSNTNKNSNKNNLSQNITFSPVINNTNSQALTQTFSFEIVKKEIEDMDISENDRKEALTMIDEMQQVAQASDKKSFWRWGKEKFLPWIIDKGSDLGVQLLGAYLSGFMM